VEVCGNLKELKSSNEECEKSFMKLLLA